MTNTIKKLEGKQIESSCPTDIIVDGRIFEIESVSEERSLTGDTIKTASGNIVTTENGVKIELTIN